VKMDEQVQATESKNGNFFAMCNQTIRNIVDAGGKAEHVIGYMILSRHTSAKGKFKYRGSTAGAQAIARRGSFTYRESEKIISWLEGNGFINRPEADAESKPKKMQYRWLLNELNDNSIVYLSNSLLDGTPGPGKDNPPMQRIINETPFPTGIKITIKDARLDSLMVLLHLYQHHDIAGSGGVDPRVGIYRKWEHTDPIEVFDDARPLLTVQEIKGAGTYFTNVAASDALYYIEDLDLIKIRYWNAFNNLSKLGFVYEVLEIWDSNPLGNDDAEILYPLYIFSRHARKSEPYLAKTIHSALINADPDGISIPNFFESITHSSQFRYAMPKEGAYPLSVFRLRFRPKTRDTGIGLDREKTRASLWEASIKRVGQEEKNRHF
jgi:hypothetical protein